jgi:hypothetical protein
MTNLCTGIVFDLQFYIKGVFYFLVVANIFTALCTISLNLIIIRTIWKTSSLHRPSMILIAGLALTDVCVGAFAQPIYIFWILAILKHVPDAYLCTSWTVYKTISYGLVFLSGFTIIIISIDRCLAVTMMTRYKTLVTSKRVIRLLMGIWSLTLLIGIWYTFYVKAEVKFMVTVTFNLVLHS